MIIRTDINTITANRQPTAERSSAPRAPRVTREAELPARQTMTRRLEMERSLGDALSIAQMSQNLVQRVLNLSLRLKNISSGALTTGKINAQELSEALSTVKSTLGEYGESVSIPLQSYASASTVRKELPDISGDMRNFREIADQMKDGNYRQTERIDALTSDLSRKSEQIKTAENTITGLMKNSAAYSSIHTDNDAEKILSRVRTSMESNPGTALYLQGNISHGAAGKIIM